MQFLIEAAVPSNLSFSQTDSQTPIGSAIQPNARARFLFDNLSNELFVWDSKERHFRPLRLDLPPSEEPYAFTDFSHWETPKTTKVTNSTNATTAISSTTKSTPKASIYSPVNPLVGKSKKIKTLKIQLGLACNYHCSYCMQASAREALKGKESHQEKKQGIASSFSPLLKIPTKPEVEHFFDTLADKGIELDPHARIELWGGEPLMYKRAIKAIIERVRKDYGEGVSIVIITNGSLINDDWVDFFLENHVFISISHDGTAFNLRDKNDPLDNPKTKKAWLRLHEGMKAWGALGTSGLSMHVVLSTQNTDLDALRAFFSEKLAKDVDISFEGIVTYEGATASENNFADNLDAAVSLRDSLFKTLVESPGAYPSLEDRLIPFMKRLIFKRSLITSMQGRCNSISENTLITTLKGEVLSCQNGFTHDSMIGSFVNEDLSSLTNRQFTHWKLRPQCKDCPVLGLCRGGCPKLAPEAFEACCKNEFLFYFSLFEVALFRLTGFYIVDIKAVHDPSVLSSLS